MVFDPKAYLELNVDLKISLKASGFRSAFEHFIKAGVQERRVGSYFFNPNEYLKTNGDVDGFILFNNLSFSYSYKHFLTVGVKEGRNSGTFFDGKYYLEANPDAAAAVASGQFSSAFAHFQAVGFAKGLSPSPKFNQDLYLDFNEDLSKAFKGGQVKNLFKHFLEFGIKEKRDADFTNSPLSDQPSQGDDFFRGGSNKDVFNGWVAMTRSLASVAMTS